MESWQQWTQQRQVARAVSELVQVRRQKYIWSIFEKSGAFFAFTRQCALSATEIRNKGLIRRSLERWQKTASLLQRCRRFGRDFIQTDERPELIKVSSFLSLCFPSGQERKANQASFMIKSWSKYARSIQVGHLESAQGHFTRHLTRRAFRSWYMSLSSIIKTNK